MLSAREHSYATDVRELIATSGHRRRWRYLALVADLTRMKLYEAIGSESAIGDTARHEPHRDPDSGRHSAGGVLGQ